MRLINKTKIITCVATTLLMVSSRMYPDEKWFHNNVDRIVRVTLTAMYSEGIFDPNKKATPHLSRTYLEPGKSGSISWDYYVGGMNISSIEKIVIEFFPVAAGSKLDTLKSNVLPAETILLEVSDGIQKNANFRIKGTTKDKIEMW